MLYNARIHKFAKNLGGISKLLAPQADIVHVSGSGPTDIWRYRTKIQSLQQAGARDLCAPDIKYKHSTVTL
jgi:hypothetical protein